jgi:hypothetical protein
MQQLDNGKEYIRFQSSSVLQTVQLPAHHKLLELSKGFDLPFKSLVAPLIVVFGHLASYNFSVSQAELTKLLNNNRRLFVDHLPLYSNQQYMRNVLCAFTVTIVSLTNYYCLSANCLPFRILLNYKIEQ